MLQPSCRSLGQDEELHRHVILKKVIRRPPVKYGGEVAIAFYPPNTPAKKLLIPLKEVKACKQAKKFAANILSKGHSLAITHGADSATVLLEGFSKTSLRDEAWALIKSLKPDIASE